MATQTIQGKAVGSVNEMYVAKALDTLKLEYIYQYQYGLINVRGSQVIDFLVFTVPKPTPLFVHGTYWHTGKKAQEDQLKMQELSTRMRNQWNDPAIIWEDECENFESALNNIRGLLIV